MSNFANSVPDGFRQLYDDEWKLEMQQLASRLQPFVNVSPVNGENKRFKRMPKFTPRRITERFGKTNPEDVAMEYRWMFVGFSDCAHMLDRRELIQLGEAGSPHDAIIRNQRAAAERDRDYTLITALGADVMTGKTPTTAVTFASECRTIAVNYSDNSGGVNSGMTFSKLLEVSTQFGLNNAAGQDVENGEYRGTVVLSHRQIKNLLLEEKLTSADYGMQRLMNGEVVAFAGMAIKAVDKDLLPYNSGTDVRTCYAFLRDCVEFGPAEEPTAFADILPDQRHDVQLRTEWGWGAVRRDPAGVIAILCDESP